MSEIRLRADVRVAPLTLEAAPQMLAWMQDPEVSGNLGLSRTPSLERTQTWIREALQENSAWPYAILWNETHVGNVVFDQLDLHLSIARFSVYIGVREARGCGVGFSGMYRAIGDVFLNRGLHKVWLMVHVENQAAIRAYRRLGFQLEGTLRDAFLLQGRRVAALYMGLLQADFDSVDVL
jgi:RimJ/RimL family protein N-acetyltransferase